MLTRQQFVSLFTVLLLPFFTNRFLCIFLQNISFLLSWCFFWGGMAKKQLKEDYSWNLIFGYREITCFISAKEHINFQDSSFFIPRYRMGNGVFFSYFLPLQLLKPRKGEPNIPFPKMRTKNTRESISWKLSKPGTEEKFSKCIWMHTHAAKELHSKLCF